MSGRPMRWRPPSHQINPERLRRKIEDELGEKVLYLGHLSNGTSYKTMLMATRRGRYTLKIPKSKDAPTLAFRQQLATNVLGGRLPIPVIRLVTRQYVLEDYIQGRNLDRVSLRGREEKHVFEQLGRHLSVIHGLKMRGFGAIGLDGTGQFSTLRLYARLGIWLPRLENWGLLDEKEFDQLVEYLNRREVYLDSEQSVMLHYDFEDHNIRVSDGCVTGLLDFADLSSGPRSLDLARPFIAHYGTERFSYMLEGYGYADIKEVEYYSVLRMVEIIPLLARAKKHKKVAHRLRVLRSLILQDT